MMLFWGWMPHLYPKFSCKYSPELFKLMAVFGLDDIERHSDDDNTENVITINTNLDDTFEYGAECIHSFMKYGKYDLTVHVTVYESGLVQYRVSDVPNDLDSDDVRHIVRELYFVMKNLYHMDIHHSRDETTSANMHHGDENFSVVEAIDEKDAIDKIFLTIIRKCENGLERYSRNTDLFMMPDRSNYIIISGFISYGRNFLNIFKSILGKDYDIYMESLGSCRDSLKSLDFSFHSELNSRVNIHTHEMNIRLMLISLLTISVGFFAGSILLDAVYGLGIDADGIVDIVTIFGILIIILSFLIVISPKISNCVNKIIGRNP